MKYFLHGAKICKQLQVCNGTGESSRRLGNLSEKAFDSEERFLDVCGLKTRLKGGWDGGG